LLHRSCFNAADETKPEAPKTKEEPKKGEVTGCLPYRGHCATWHCLARALRGNNVMLESDVLAMHTELWHSQHCASLATMCWSEGLP